MARPASAPTLDELFPDGRPVLLDGAMGTALHARGWPPGKATALANLDAPGDVEAVHTAHREAGARVLATNTFVALHVADEERRDRCLRAGVRLAREAAGPHARVAGCLAAVALAGNAPRLTAALGALLDEGVDLLLFETAVHPEDALAAMSVCRGLGLSVPVVISVSTTDGGAQDHIRARGVVAAIRAAAEAHVEVGLNCGRGPDDLLALQTSLPEPARWLAPNTGLCAPRPAATSPSEPLNEDGATARGDDPRGLTGDDAMAEFARRALASGARFVGACCGSTSATLDAMAAALPGANP